MRRECHRTEEKVGEKGGNKLVVVVARRRRRSK